MGAACSCQLLSEAPPCLAILAFQLNNDMTHLQGQRLEAALGQLAEEVREHWSSRRTTT